MNDVLSVGVAPLSLEASITESMSTDNDYCAMLCVFGLHWIVEPACAALSPQVMLLGLREDGSTDCAKWYLPYLVISPGRTSRLIASSYAILNPSAWERAFRASSVAIVDQKVLIERPVGQEKAGRSSGNQQQLVIASQFEVVVVWKS